MTDNFETHEQLPVIEGEEILYLGIITNQYRGVRPLGTYLRVYFAPFIEDLRSGITILLLVMLIGFYGIQSVDQVMAPSQDQRRYARRAAFWMLMVAPPLMFVLVSGIGIGPLGFTDPRRWGGLLLAAILTIFGIIFAFPLGVGLALGRRSQLPAIKYLCTLFIEIVRGTPFIVVLFMMQLMIPLVSPKLAEIPNAHRALIATVVFVAAYLAENVRGGLQSLPPGQEEAAKALGLSNWQTTIFITLPQALRAVIPALVGQFISMFKDTSLVAIVGLIDLTGIVNSVVVQAEFIGTRREGLLFITIIYFGFSYVMSYVSRQIEASGSGAARRI
jgi:general L-amino acid transport system permease protein